jgi:hypothetical protein
MLTTPIFALPYPEGSDLVQEGNDAIQELAETIEDAINPPWNTLTPLSPGYTARAGWLTPAYQLRDDGQVELRGAMTKSTAILSGETLFTLPVEARPTASVAFGVVVSRSDATKSPAAKITITTTGNATVEVIDSQAPTSIMLDGGRFNQGLVFETE